MMRSPDRDEGRHQHADAVFEHGRLVGGGRGLALHDRIGFGDGQRHLVGQRDADRPLVVKLDGDHHAVLQEGGAVADEILLQLELLVAFGVHEHQRVALLVEEGEILLLQPDLLDRLGGAEALVELGAVDQVLQFDLVVGAALAGLDVIGPDRHPQAAIMLDDVAGTDFVAVDLGHDVVPEEILRPIGEFGASRPQIASKGKRCGPPRRRGACDQLQRSRLAFSMRLLGLFGGQPVQEVVHLADRSARRGGPGCTRRRR